MISRSEKVQIDALVEGRYGSTDKVGTIRVTATSPFGWVAGVTPDSRQAIIYPPFVTLAPPRPELMRGDIPSQLR